MPFALAIPREPCGCRGSDSDCEAFAAGDGPSTTGSTQQYAGSVLPKPLQATLGGHRLGGDSQTRPVRPTSPRPPFTDVPALRSGRPRVGSRLPFCYTLTGYHRENAPPTLTGRQPSSPDDPWREPPGRRTSRAARSLRGRVGLLGQTPFAGGGHPRDGVCPLTGVTPGYPDDAKPPDTEPPSRTAGAVVVRLGELPRFTPTSFPSAHRAIATMLRTKKAVRTALAYTACRPEGRKRFAGPHSR